ncbi:carotenoid 9,10(9',10')-cleavage dioxygenase 1-like [Quillaja saponaria]|uniref:Carotenoid 9,10(9',10')-cleavage dioxygenase 1-like n=1 Tax=Quillaja saponaria TaxID=32244 RepID=A0AAD7PSL8_QUISA|nr:carotenoid 9,10(9',10')-cleavage dioxygenase 1-like [Quillaja saponaria]
MTVSSLFLQHVNGSVHKRPTTHRFDHFKTSFSSTLKPFFKELQQLPLKIDVSKTIRDASSRVLDAFVESVFQIVDQPLLPSQKNFGPVEELGEAVIVTSIEGEIPVDFSEGVFIRNGPNPLFGGLKSTESIFGRTSHTWIEGEGMLHAVYFKKAFSGGNWEISYNNKYVDTETLKLEKERNKPSFLPELEGDSLALLASLLLNKLRFGIETKHLTNTNVFEHAGKVYAITDNYLPLEVDISTLETFSVWNVNGTWNRAFTSHPKRDPESGELVIAGIDVKKPYFVVGVISADGTRLTHSVDAKFDKSVLSHELGVTRRYNIIMDYPLTLDINRLIMGGELLEYDKEGNARLGVMPRYGDSHSVQWFKVETSCTLHILNCFEDGDEVVVRGCRALTSILPGPRRGVNKFEWFSKGFKFVNSEKKDANDTTQDDGYLFIHVYEWRLNMANGEVREKKLTDTSFSMDFPFTNGHFTGLKHKYGYTQIIDSMASSTSGMAKYGGLAKLHFEDPNTTFSEEYENCEQPIKVKYHMFEPNNFCSGSVFVSKDEAVEEDDGWIVSFVHNEINEVSQVHIIDARNFTSEAIAKITLPQRVPYGFHGTFVPTPEEH